MRMEVLRATSLDPFFYFWTLDSRAEKSTASLTPCFRSVLHKMFHDRRTILEHDPRSTHNHGQYARWGKMSLLVLGSMLILMLLLLRSNPEGR